MNAINRTLSIATTNMKTTNMASDYYDYVRNQIAQHFDRIENSQLEARTLEQSNASSNYSSQVRAYFRTANEFGLLDRLPLRRPSSPGPRRQN